MQVIIKLSFIIATIDTIYNTYKIITDEHLMGRITDSYIDSIIKIAKSQLHKQITMIIYLTPAINQFLFINSKTNLGKAVFTAAEREKAYIPDVIFDPNHLLDYQIKLYNDIWTMSMFVEVENKKLVIKPFRREPP